MNGCIKAVVLWLSLSSAVYAERLPNFIVIHWDGNAYDVPEFGISYYVIFGYNPKTKQGEGLFYVDACW